MKTALAYIHWLSYEKGGRKTDISPGSMYYPHIVLATDFQQVGWSIAFLMTPLDSQRNNLIEFSMLVSNDDSDSFMNLLKPGTLFNLLEGSKIVAFGTIL